jgi:hypothetical protein
LAFISIKLYNNINYIPSFSRASSSLKSQYWTTTYKQPFITRNLPRKFNLTVTRNHLVFLSKINPKLAQQFLEFQSLTDSKRPFDFLCSYWYSSRACSAPVRASASIVCQISDSTILWRLIFKPTGLIYLLWIICKCEYFDLGLVIDISLGQYWCVCVCVCVVMLICGSLLSFSH